jgi:hypothetical protein
MNTEKRRTDDFGNKVLEQRIIRWVTSDFKSMETAIGFPDVPLVKAHALDESEILVRDGFYDHSKKRGARKES